MFRALLYLLITIVLISLIRGVVGIIMRAFSDMTASSQGGPRRTSRPDPVPLTGELKKDPVCGTYTAAATAIKQTVRGETVYFCSPACRDKYVATLS